jgi:hypothetical protein
MLHHVALVRTDVSEERQFLQEAHSVTSQKTAFFIVTAVKTWNPTTLPFLVQKRGERTKETSMMLV